MNQWEIDLGKEINRNKREIIEPCIGVVVTDKPFTATIHDGLIRLSKKNTYICESVLERVSPALGNKQATLERNVISLKGVLKPGMQVLVIPINKGQQFVIVDALAGGWL